MENNLKINHGAVWVIVVLGQVLPALWYGLFADQWMAMNNLTEEMATDVGSSPYIVSIVTAIAFGYMFAWIYKRMNINTALDGAVTGFIIGFPVAILDTMTVNMFSIRPYGLAWIDGGQSLLLWIVGGLILGAWTKYEK